MEAIVTDPEVLHKKSVNVETVEEAETLIRRLENNLSFIPNGIGLAAIQIGIPKRIAVIKETGKDPIYLINSEVVEANTPFSNEGEGCLSIPSKKFNVVRSRDFTIRNVVIDNGKFREETKHYYYVDKDENKWSDGLTAIAVQHEIDHFDGILLSDIVVPNEPMTVKRPPKIGRNDPCPCGSGKKFKKCCLA